MTVIYKTTITEVGCLAQQFIDQNIILLFSKDSVMSEIKNYSCLIEPSELNSLIQEGDILEIGNFKSKVIKVGSLVNENLANISHITIKYEIPRDEGFAGTLYCQPVDNKEVKSGDILSISR